MVQFLGLSSPRVSWMMTGNPSPPAMMARQYGRDDPRVFGEADEVVAVDGESCVVEPGDCVEGPVPEGGGGILVVGHPESGGQEQGGCGFKREHDLGYPDQDGPDVAEVQGVGFCLGDQLSAQADVFADQQCQQGGQGHDAEPAHLDEPEDDALA
jgi:hypothetical protein